MPADILLYALIAAVLVFWLRNTLGTRHGDERQRPNPFSSHPEEKDSASGETKNEGNILNLPQGAQLRPELNREDNEQNESNPAIANESAQKGIDEIAGHDRGFDLNHFISGACDAFAIIVEAYARNDRETLQSLLHDTVYDVFEQDITQREKNGETLETEIHAVREAKVIDAGIKNQIAYLSVRFEAEETSVRRDSEGNILSGDPERITKMHDVWTFGRHVKSRDPTWYLYETRSDHPDNEGAGEVPVSEDEPG